jgi:hypothetical protein
MNYVPGDELLRFLYNGSGGQHGIVKSMKGDDGHGGRPVVAFGSLRRSGRPTFSSLQRSKLPVWHHFSHVIGNHFLSSKNQLSETPLRF